MASHNWSLYQHGTRWTSSLVKLTISIVSRDLSLLTRHCGRLRTPTAAAEAEVGLFQMKSWKVVSQDEMRGDEMRGDEMRWDDARQILRIRCHMSFPFDIFEDLSLTICLQMRCHLSRFWCSNIEQSLILERLGSSSCKPPAPQREDQHYCHEGTSSFSSTLYKTFWNW